VGWLWVLIIVVGGLLVYVRLAPSDVARWHAMGEIKGDKTFKNGVIRVVDDAPDGLAKLDAVIQATDRTTVLAGSVSDGMVTYITRSKLMGYPDYTTVRQSGARVEIYARSRFGRSDIGVNKARVEGWLALGQF